MLLFFRQKLCSYSQKCFLLFQYLRILAVAYEKTLELAKELDTIGCGDLDVEGILDLGTEIEFTLQYGLLSRNKHIFKATLDFFSYATCHTSFQYSELLLMQIKTWLGAWEKQLSI